MPTAYGRKIKALRHAYDHKGRAVIAGMILECTYKQFGVTLTVAGEQGSYYFDNEVLEDHLQAGTFEKLGEMR